VCGDCGLNWVTFSLVKLRAKHSLSLYLRLPAHILCPIQRILDYPYLLPILPSFTYIYIHLYFANRQHKQIREKINNQWRVRDCTLDFCLCSSEVGRNTVGVARCICCILFQWIAGPYHDQSFAAPAAWAAEHGMSHRWAYDTVKWQAVRGQNEDCMEDHTYRLAAQGD